MAKFWEFRTIKNQIKNALGETQEAEEAELLISGEMVDDDSAFFYDFFGIPNISPNAFKQELAQYKGMPVNVVINSFGGSMFAGVSIANALNEHRKTARVSGRVDAIAGSAATIPATACYPFKMSAGSQYVIHNPAMEASGDYRTMEHAAEVLKSCRDSIANTYMAKTKHTRAKIAGMMDNETWMDASKAVSEGFADEIINIGEQSGVTNILNFGFSKEVVNEIFKGYIKKDLQMILDYEKAHIKNGVDPGNISTDKAPEDQTWEKPALKDFTDKTWGELTDDEKKDIAKHYAWAAEMPPTIFGDLKYGHHDPKSHKAVYEGLVACAERIDQSDISADEIEKIVKPHLEKHYHDFNKKAPWEKDNELEKEKLLLEIDLL